MRTIAGLIGIGLRLGIKVAGICLIGSYPTVGQQAAFPKKTGVQTAGVERAMEELPKVATLVVKGEPDWMAVTSDAVWVTSRLVRCLGF